MQANKNTQAQDGKVQAAHTSQAAETIQGSKQQQDSRQVQDDMKEAQSNADAQASAQTGTVACSPYPEYHFCRSVKPHLIISFTYGCLDPECQFCRISLGLR